MTTTKVETHADRVARLKREHRERVEKLKTDADAQIARTKQHRDSLVAESKLHRELLREESIARRRQKDRVELASRRGHRDFLGQIGAPLSLTDRRQMVDEWRMAPDDDNPAVRVLASWLRRTWASEGIDSRECAEPLLSNGAAVRTLRFIEVAPLRSVRACLIAAHETGHILHEPLADERAVKGELGERISVPCEIAAWRWVLDHVPIWTRDMHDDMTRFVTSYRSYATSEEAAAIDHLCSSWTFRATQLRIIKGSL